MTEKEFTKLVHKTYNKAEVLLFEDPALKQIGWLPILQDIANKATSIPPTYLIVAHLIVSKAHLLIESVATTFFFQKDQSIKVLCQKADEYADDEDRLYNFKRAAYFAKTTPSDVCYGFMLKHLVSVEDLLIGRIRKTQGLIDEKFGDLINYQMLYKACKIDETKERR